MGPVPDSWFNYTDSARITGTRFVACKVPLPEVVCSRLSYNKRFSPRNLLEKYPSIKLVFNLTNANYYDGEREFRQKGVQYLKIRCEGHSIPREDNFKMFLNAVDKFLSENPSSGLIVVHCTHGLNRTGYFICRYMVERMGFFPQDAFQVFESSRCHRIERPQYKLDIIRRYGCSGQN